MIKPETLRIGNLLNWNGCICPVVSIEEESFTVADPSQNKMSSNYHYAPDEVIVEWELTEEWLVKMGWKNDGFDPIVLSLDRHSETHWNTYLEDKHCHKLGHIRLVQYVHELQNLYFVLTGKELEII